MNDILVSLEFEVVEACLASLELEALENTIDIPISVEEVRTVYVYPNQYDGETVIIPSSEEQVLDTAEKTVMEPIVIKPIPQNYGLITYNGSVITVS